MLPPNACRGGNQRSFVLASAHPSVVRFSSKDLLFFHAADGRRMTAKSKTKDLSFETQTCPAGWMVQVRRRLGGCTMYMPHTL